LTFNFSRQTFVAVATSATSFDVFTPLGRRRLLLFQLIAARSKRPMMMAHDSTPNRPQLSSASVEGLRLALSKYLVESDDTASLQVALREVAADARTKEMRAEHLLLALKDVWYGLPQVSRTPEGEEQHRLLQRVVTLCIREYYGG
jgi:hypothetical protein